MGREEEPSIRELETRLRDQVAAVELLAELELAREEIDTMLQLVAAEWTIGSRAYAAKRISARFPATFAAAVSGGASIHYDRGELWSPLFRAAGIPHDSSDANGWGRLFLRCLENLGLTTFPELDEVPVHRYLARILLHAGVPTYCFSDWYELLSAASRTTGSDDAADLVAHLNAREQLGRLYNIDVPVRRFIALGGDFAVDFLDRSLDLFEAIRTNGELDGIGLPQRFIDAAVAVASATKGDRSLRSSGTSSARPALAFDPYGLGVHVVLPSVDAGTGVVWRVGFDEVVHTHHAPSDAGGVTRGLELPVPPLVTRITVEAHGRRHEFRIDGTDPLLLFGKDGVLVPATGRIRAAEVWAVHPTSWELQDRGQRSVERVPSIHRWDGWTGARYDLSGATGLGLVGGRLRIVDLHARPQLDGLMLEHVVSIGGAPVFGEWPTLTLPPSAEQATWSVRLETAGSARTQVVAGADAGLVIQLDELLPGTPAGVMDLTVRGPLGQGLKHTMVVAPGAAIDLRPAWRTFTADGLSASTVLVTHPTDDTEHVGVAPGQAECRIFLRTSAGTDVPVIVRPPGMASQLVRAGDPVQWLHSVRTIATEDLLDEPGQLLVRVDPEGGTPRLHIVSVDGETVQIVDPSGRSGNGLASYNLARMTESVAATRACDLILVTAGRRDRVARVRPARLARGVALDPGAGVLWMDQLAATGVVAAVYRHLDPVQPSHHGVVCNDGSLPIPSELIGAGPLRVLLRVDDPWVPQPWPAFPYVGRNVFDVEQELPSTATTPVEALLLDGDVRSGPGSLGALLRAYPYLFRLPRDAFDVAAASWSIRVAVSADAPTAVRTLVDGDADAEDLVAAAVDLDLVAHDLGELPHEDVERFLDRWAPLGVAAASPLLRREGNGGPTSTDLALDVGPEFIQILEDEDDSALARPVIADDALLRLPTEILDTVFREAGIVPSPLLHADSQAMAGRDLVVALGERRSGLSPTEVDWDDLLEDLDRRLRPVAPDRLLRAIMGRVHGRGAQLAPAVVLAIAAAARLDARASIDTRVGRAWWRRAFLRVAKNVPRLVAADLVLAEAVLLSEEA